MQRAGLWRRIANCRLRLVVGRTGGAAPTPPRTAGVLAAWAGFSAVALLAVLYYATARGQDFNWDQRNYHLGVPFLLQHGRFWQSIEPAGIQSYFNPAVLQMQFWVLSHVGAVTAAAILGAVQSTAFMVAGALSCAIAAGRGAGAWAALLGAGLSLLSPVALSEAGGTYIDLVTAVPVLGAYALLLTRGRRLRGLTAGAAAGSLLGAATALKLTNGLFVLGVAGFALAGADSYRERARWLLACGAAAGLAFAAVGGGWYLQVWRHFGNPLFPFYNGIFHSPDAVIDDDSLVAGTLQDKRFLPRSVLALWRYPLYWLLGGSPNPALKSPSAEVAFIDPRWAATPWRSKSCAGRFCWCFRWQPGAVSCGWVGWPPLRAPVRCSWWFRIGGIFHGAPAGSRSGRFWPP